MYVHTKIIEKGLVLYTERERESERQRGGAGGSGREVKHKGLHADII